MLAAGLAEIIFLSWVCRLDVIQDHINKTSDFAIGNWWVFCLKIITPVGLGVTWGGAAVCIAIAIRAKKL